MANRSNGFQAGIGMVLILLAVSIIVPSLFLATETPQTNTFEQRELVRETLTGEVSTEVIQVTNQEEANITVLNRRDGSIANSGTLAEGENTTVMISGEQINIELVSVVDPENVLVRYTYPLYLGWPSGAETIIKNITDIIILSTVIMLIGSIFTGYKVYTQ